MVEIDFDKCSCVCETVTEAIIETKTITTLEILEIIFIVLIVVVIILGTVWAFNKLNESDEDEPPSYY